jgi:SAM-dependent methyltransferase
VTSEDYTADFFAGLRSGAERSAQVIVPLVVNLLHPRSVVDVGCGEGTWLAGFRRLGVEDLLGIDGDYVERDRLQIPHENFQAADLSRPLAVPRTFDLAVSLEVAEHLPQECAALFVESLTRLAPVVLFSAAIPFQGGNHHVNEQWPDKWAELFKRHDYLPVDFIRKRVWKNEAVEWWYTQNTLLFAQDKLLDTNALLKSEFERTNLDQLRVVHPRQFLHLEKRYREALALAETPPGIKVAFRMLLASLTNSIRWRLGQSQGKEIDLNRPAKSEQPRI